MVFGRMDNFYLF